MKARQLLVLMTVFATGVLVGVYVGRDTSVPPAPAAADALVAGPDATRAPPAPDAPATSAASPRIGTPASSSPAPAHTPGPAPVPVAAGRTPPIPGSPRHEPSTYAPPVDSGVVRSIDVGDVLRKQVDRPSEPGNENHIGDAHRALEREPRDEGWAYTMEAELQNTLLAETSTGGFRAENVECRATMCEVWVTGNGEQAAAVRRWSESLATNPMNSALQLNMSSTISNHDRVDGLFIFRKPAKR